MKRLFFLLVTACFCAGLHSQQFECDCSETDGSYNSYFQNLLISREYNNPIQHFRGEQFFNVWAPGNITMVNGETVSGMLLRYDKYQDQVLWLRQTDFKTGVINKSIVSGFDVYHEDHQLAGSFIRKKINSPGMGAVDAYLQILTEGPVGFYVFRNVVKAISVSRTVDNNLYYLGIDSNLYPVALRRKSLLRSPGIDKDIMKGIIRSNHLTLYQDEADFTKAVYLYNESLMQ
ncbi:MAG: hypothetical protein JXB19_12180 [Bacteroidales bacterium]|nr:hypothetical protein [Bacteroidales bacterium]